MDRQFVLVLDFGGQYNQLIARRVREHNVYCEVKPFTLSAREVAALSPIGIILTGGPSDVNAPDAPRLDPAIYGLGIPMLGICYGQQIMTVQLGGTVTKAPKPEYGHADVDFGENVLFDGCDKHASVWMSHTSHVETPAPGFRTIATSPSCPHAALADEKRGFYCVQFHPEVNHTPQGRAYLENFLYKVCGARGDWKMSAFAEEYIRSVRARIGDKKVLCALSGGVDSSVAATLLAKAVGKQLTCIFVDNGMMRLHEGDEVEAVFGEKGNLGLQFVRVNAEQRFLTKLAGVTDPERKRKIIGEEFIRVFEAEAGKLGEVDYLVQGTIYPDVIESGLGHSAVIKSHHNVGGLPEHIRFKELIEPLRMLFKDEVRALGLELGLPEALVYRQPFPGPGLAVRCLGEITKYKLDILREADAIFREEIAAAGLERAINQYFAVITDLRSVGVMGDERTYDYTIALRAVTTTDFMTADWAEIPFPVLKKISNRIVNEVRHVNRVVYDVTSKPPATIEWE